MAWGKDILARFPDWGSDAALARWPEVRQVIARAPFGVWVDIDAGHPALLLVPEMAEARERCIGFEDYPPIGAMVEARIVGLGDRAQIALSQRQ